ncbi:hypothetical protein C8R42DRAFT_674392 [Lentinula raphanica]|nr:hypothetical protein C8R42DRAFT_674392 [Lentinula raphanica]
MLNILRSLVSSNIFIVLFPIMNLQFLLPEATTDAPSDAHHTQPHSAREDSHRPLSKQDPPVLLPAKAASAQSDEQPYSALEDLHRPLSEQGPPALQHERTSAPSHARHPTSESSFPEVHRLPSEHGPPVLPHDSEQTSFLDDLNSPLSPGQNHPPEPHQHLAHPVSKGMDLGDSHSHRQGTAVSNDYWPGTVPPGHTKDWPGTVSSHDNQLDMGPPGPGHLQSTVPSSHDYQQNTDTGFGSWFGLSQPRGTMYGNSHQNMAPGNVQTYNTQPTGQIQGHPQATSSHPPSKIVPSNGDMGTNTPMEGG